MLKFQDNHTTIIEALEAACKTAFQQINNLNYVTELKDAEMETIDASGVACYKKAAESNAGNGAFFIAAFFS